MKRNPRFPAIASSPTTKRYYWCNLGNTEIVTLDLERDIDVVSSKSDEDLNVHLVGQINTSDQLISSVQVKEKIVAVDLKTHSSLSPQIVADVGVETPNHGPSSVRINAKEVSKNTIILAKSGSYNIFDKLGEGSFGCVFAVEDKKNQQFAIKILKHRPESSISNTHTVEQKVFARIGAKKHSNLLDLHAADTLLNPRKGWSINVLLVKLYGGSIIDIMNAANKKAIKVYGMGKYACQFTLRDTRSIARQIAEAMHHLETLGVYHLDLKPGNVLFCNGKFDLVSSTSQPYIVMPSYNVKVADFGMCCFHDEEEKPRKPRRVQTTVFRAPEVFIGLPYNNTSDVWSYGALLGQLCTGSLLFFGAHTHDLKCDYENQLHMMQKVVGQEIPTRLWDEAEKLGASYRVLRPAPNNKHNFNPSAPLKKLISDPHMSEFLHFVLKIDYTKRPTFQELLRHQFFEEKENEQENGKNKEEDLAKKKDEENAEKRMWMLERKRKNERKRQLRLMLAPPKSTSARILRSSRKVSGSDHAKDH